MIVRMISFLLFTRLSCPFLSVLILFGTYVCCCKAMAEELTSSSNSSLLRRQLQGHSSNRQLTIISSRNHNIKIAKRITLQQYFAATTTATNTERQQQKRRTEQVSHIRPKNKNENKNQNKTVFSCHVCLAKYDNEKNINSSFNSEIESLFELYHIDRKLDDKSNSSISNNKNYYNCSDFQNKQPLNGTNCFTLAIASAAFSIVFYIPFLLASPIFLYFIAVTTCQRDDKCTNSFPLYISYLVDLPYYFLIEYPYSIVYALFNCGKIPGESKNYDTNEIKRIVQSILSNNFHEFIIHDVITMTTDIFTNNGTASKNVNNNNRLLLNYIRTENTDFGNNTRTIEEYLSSEMKRNLEVILKNIDDFDGEKIIDDAIGM